MHFTKLERLLPAAAFAAAAFVAGMLAIYLATGVGQEALQFVHPQDEYLRLLLADPGALRATIGLDNVFIVLYSTVVVALGVLLVRDGANRALTTVAIVLLGLTGLFDYLENLHFLTMLSSAEQGLGVTLNEIRGQVFESMLKFHVSYAGLFMLGTVMPRRTARERAVAGAAMYLQLPVGILVYTAPPSLAHAMVLVRTAFFVTALCGLGAAYRRRAAMQPVALAA